MKNCFVKMLFAVVLVGAILLSTVSCGGDLGGTVMSYGKSEVGERMYNYWASQFKGYVLSSFSGASDTEEFWAATLDNGMTMEEYTDGIIQANIKKNLISMEWFDKYGLKLSDESLSAVDADIADLIESYGSKSNLNADLAHYGVNVDILREIYTIQEKIAVLYEHMNTAGIISPSDEVLEKYFTDHYARIKYVTIVMANVSTDESGKATYSSLTEDERAAKEAKIAEVMAKLDSGVSMDEVIAEYSEVDMTGYENGVYISTNNSGYAIIDAALEMEVGETKRIDQESAVYIVERLELEKKPYLDDKMGQFADLATYCADEEFQNMLTAEFEGVTVDEKLAEKYSVRNVYYGANVG